MTFQHRHIPLIIGLAVVVALTVGGCGWHGVNSLSLPGTAGGGPGSYEVQAQLPDVTNLEQNSRVRVGDVTVGNVIKVERQGWHALITMRLGGDVQLPANATAKIGQTSLLGSLHVELAPPTGVPAQGKLHNGSLIPLSAGSSYPTTEQTLAAVSMLLNGGGISQLQDITTAFSTAFAGRGQDLRVLIEQLEQFVGHLNHQVDDIIAATESLNSLVGQLADQKPVLDKALTTIPRALTVLKDERNPLGDAFDQLGKFSALAADSVNNTKEALIEEFKDLGPVLSSLANAGPALTRSLGVIATYPYPKDTLKNFQRGDSANGTFIFDLTLSRLDSSIFTGTRFEGALTRLELQWGRTLGQTPSPYTAANPIVAPYHMNQVR
ncbi:MULTISPECIES: virulence factor Mce family protein [Mycobacterium]|uniref:virulence factor Mce family protein n=1 Tax=Mycobacterium TaxID=1763 RepID=UPI0024B0554B|nr:MULTISPECIES: virulence factor Mce family protein [Mycobacterium]WSE46143.1 virulence factor Mce family protein [Mycobacterium sp. 3-98]